MKWISFRQLTLLAFALVCSLKVAAQQPAAIVELWEGATPPTDSGLKGNEVDHGRYITNVVTPTLTVYVPEHCNGRAVIAVPGGGYTAVWVGTEGHNYARRFLEQGITFAVLKYRMPNGHPTVPSEDLRRAITIMRQHSGEWGGFSVLGLMGSSAGGHLVATAATKFTGSTRPDFQILCYPVVSLQDANKTHIGSIKGLLGTNPTQEMIDLYSCERHVTGKTPRAFIMHASDDDVVRPVASTLYADALVKKGIRTELHIYPNGNHGCCTSDKWEYADEFWHSLMRFINSFELAGTFHEDSEVETK